MADRVLRGSRLGAVSYETDRNHDLAPRQLAKYRTENGEEFEVPFADDAADLSDRVYQVRCAAEDVATALDEGAGATELRELCDALIRAARAADGWRRVGV